MRIKCNRIAVIVMVATLFSCNQKPKEKTLSEYKYAEKGIVVNCENFDVKLLSEAIFAFEDDITKYYGKENPNVTRAYSQFIRDVTYKRAKFAEIASPHALAIAKVLKSKTDLWASKSLNYEGATVNCIANNLTNKDLKTTMNALLQTNSMSLKFFAPAVQSNYSSAVRDKYLAAYIALEFYYANLLDIEPKAPETATKEE